MKYERKTDPLVNKRAFVRRVAKAFLISFGIIALSLVIGIIGYHFIGELGWIDSLLNSSMILTGMGPVDRMTSDSAKIFASFYSLFSGLAFLTTMGILISPILHRFLHKFHISSEE